MKKNTIKKVLSCVLSAFLLFGVAACGDKEPTYGVLSEEEIAKIADKIPTYTDTSKQFNFIGYSGVTDGTWVEDGVTYFSGEDFRNVDRIIEYKEAGMTIVLPQSAASVDTTVGDNFAFEGSKLQEVMDMSVQAGIPKVIVADYRLYNVVGTIYQDATAYSDEAELDAKIRTLMSPYVEHEAFYGVMLNDEPGYEYLPAIGRVYKAIKRCYPEAFIFCNLYPPVGGTVGPGLVFETPSEEELAKYAETGVYAERLAAFEKYLKQFLDETGADYVMYDAYPLRTSGLYENYLGGLQVAANVCAERGVQFHFASQTMTMRTPSVENDRILSEADLRWLNNMQLGLGVKQISYFTYYTKQANSSSGEWFIDRGSFITHLGEKTDIYYYMQKILAENQKFAPVILSFEYTTSAAYAAPLASFGTTNASSCRVGTFAKLASVEIDKETALVTEMYDSENNRYMYMLQNIIDPQYKASTTYQKITIKFNESYEYAVVYKNAERYIVRMKDSTYTVSQNPGEAVYVIPFNA